MHKKTLSLFTKIWALIALVILAMTIGCSDTKDPNQLNPGVHKINHHSFFINSLGMQFAPVSGKKTWLSVWETRVKDYATYATNKTWQAAWFQDSQDHPAVNIRWKDAQEFCAWLTQRERQAGILSKNEGLSLIHI